MNNPVWRRSSVCADGSCVEVAWQSACASSNCVEVACSGGQVLVRDSKLGEESPVARYPLDFWAHFIGAVKAHPAGNLARPMIWQGFFDFTEEELTAFVAGVRNGEFDSLTAEWRSAALADVDPSRYPHSTLEPRSVDDSAHGTAARPVQVGRSATSARSVASGGPAIPAAWQTARTPTTRRQTVSETPADVYEAQAKVARMRHVVEEAEAYIAAIKEGDMVGCAALEAAVDRYVAAGRAAATPDGGTWEYGRRVVDGDATWEDWPPRATWSEQWAPISGPIPPGATVTVLRRWQPKPGPVEPVAADETETGR